MVTEELDNMFKQYALQSEEEARVKSSFKGSTKEYEEIKHTGCDKNVPKVVRVVGGLFNSEIDDYTAKTVTICWVVGDDGKKFRIIRPSYSEDPNYILNKIIAKVKATKYIDDPQKGLKTKVYPIQEKYPEIFNIIEKNGLNPKDSQYKFDKGWNGSEVLIMNVIDRENMEWHRQNKHTMLLAKSVREVNGVEYAEEGISAYATIPTFKNLFKYYGSWEKYDIAITRTGEMNNAYIIDNATKNPEKVDMGKDKYISFDTSLTNEEEGWERYNIKKLFRYTTNTKIYNRLKGTIARIDTALNTHFLNELEVAVANEKKLFDELYGNKEEQPNIEEAPFDTTPYSANTASNVETFGGVTGLEEPAKVITPVMDYEAWKLLPFGSTLSIDMRKKVKSVAKRNDNTYDITWVDFDENGNEVPMSIRKLASCPEPNCRAVSPVELTKCPCCGRDYV